MKNKTTKEIKFEQEFEKLTNLKLTRLFNTIKIGKTMEKHNYFVKIYLNLGLTLVTTERQKKNGTLKFYDPKTDVYYTFNAISGYYRRQVSNMNRYMRCNMTEHYQLNPVLTKSERDHFKNKNVRPLSRKLIFDLELQMSLALNPILKYRLHNRS